MAFIQTISLGSTLKYFTCVSAIGMVLNLFLPSFSQAQDAGGAYRIKRSGEVVPLPAGPQGSEPGPKEVPLPPPSPKQTEPPRVFLWDHSSPKKTRRYERWVEPGQYLDHSLFGRILEKYVNKHGWVNYRGLKRDKRAMASLKAYVDDLSRINPNTLTDPMDRLAAWLNLYNSLILLDITEHYPIKNLMQIPDFFGKPRFKIGDRTFSPIQIEQEIFKDQLREPRAVLARVNGASSGPRFSREPFKATKLDEQLDERTWKFLLDRKNVDYDSRTRTLKLNPTFLWYQEEFGDLLLFFRSYLDLLPQSFLVSYTGYDWQLNDEKLH